MNGSKVGPRNQKISWLEALWACLLLSVIALPYTFIVGLVQP
jgi:hypothetical protein